MAIAELFLLLKELCVPKTCFVGQSPGPKSLTGSQQGIWPEHQGLQGDVTAACVRVCLFTVPDVHAHACVGTFHFCC